MININLYNNSSNILLKKNFLIRIFYFFYKYKCYHNLVYKKTITRERPEHARVTTNTIVLYYIILYYMYCI